MTRWEGLQCGQLSGLKPELLDLLHDSQHASIIVLLEDFVLIQEDIRLLLKSECDVVAAVEDGESALTAVTNHEPDVLLVDVSLPGMNGFAVTKS